MQANSRVGINRLSRPLPVRWNFVCSGGVYPRLQGASIHLTWKKSLGCGTGFPAAITTDYLAKYKQPGRRCVCQWMPQCIILYKGNYLISYKFNMKYPIKQDTMSSTHLSTDNPSKYTWFNIFFSYSSIADYNMYGFSIRLFFSPYVQSKRNCTDSVHR